MPRMYAPLGIAPQCFLRSLLLRVASQELVIRCRLVIRGTSLYALGNTLLPLIERSLGPYSLRPAVLKPNGKRL